MLNRLFIASSELSKGNTFAVLGKISDCGNDVEIVAWGCDNKDEIITLIDDASSQIKEMEKMGMFIKIDNLQDYYELIHSKTCKHSIPENLAKNLRDFISNHDRNCAHFLRDDRIMYLKN